MFMHNNSSVHLAPNSSSVGFQGSPTEVYEEEMAHFEASLDEHVVHYLRNHPEFYDKHNIVRSRPGVYNLDGREISVDWHFPDNPAEQGYLVVVDGGTRQPFSDYVEGRKMTRPAAPAPAPAQSSVQQAGNAHTHGSPMYCANHNSTEKRKKTQPRSLPCARCKNVIQTNYVDFQVCPACSEAEQLCMCCGKPAAGSAQVSSQASSQQQCQPVYCNAHSQSEKRKKGKPRNAQCSSCSKSMQTNYVEFALCPECSRSQGRCMCCQNAACGNQSPANLLLGMPSPCKEATKMQQSSPNGLLAGLAMFSPQKATNASPNPMASLSPMACSPQNRLTSFMSASPQHMAYSGSSPMGGDLMASRRFF